MAAIEQLAAESFSSQQVPEAASSLFGPLIEAVRPVMGTISAIVGGLFGLYLFYVIFRVYYERKKVSLLKDIRYDLDYLNQNFKLPYSCEKKFNKKILTLGEYRERKKEKEQRKKQKELQKIKKRKERENGKKRFFFF